MGKILAKIFLSSLLFSFMVFLGAYPFLFSRSLTTSSKSDNAQIWGTLKMSGPKEVKAGSFQTFRITYVAGRYGVDDGASFRLLLRTLTDCGPLQSEFPDRADFMSAETTGEAKIQLSFLIHGDPGVVRPWETVIFARVSSGYLKEGDCLTITLGDRSLGSPGWRMQTFCEPTFEIRAEVNPFGTGIFEPLPDRLIFSIIPDEPIRAVAVAPSIVQRGNPFAVRLRFEDKFGNPSSESREIKNKGIDFLGSHRLFVEDPETHLQCYTNPISVRESETDEFLYWADLHAQSEETVGTNPLEDYLEFAKNMACLDVFSNQGHDYQISEKFWGHLENLMKKFYEPGKFVTFPGYEWSGNTAVGGDHNVYFKNEGHKISRSSRALVRDEECAFPDSPTIEDLYQNYKGEQEVMIFAHVGGRWADLRRPNPDLAQAVEVHSNWGTFEWFLKDAFSRNMRIGIVANSDDFRGRPGASYPASDWAGGYGGLTAVYAKKLDRDSIWEALKERHCYATTGSRIYLDVLMNKEIPMGEVIKDTQAKDLFVSVAGTAPIERIDVRNGMEVVYSVHPYTDKDLGNRIKIIWNGAASRGRSRKLTWDGNLKISGNRILKHSLVNFYGLQKDRFRCKEEEADWISSTTGGNAGVILELEDKYGGDLVLNTQNVSFRIPVSDIGLKEKIYFVKEGLETWLSVYRLPREGTSDYQFKWRVKGLKKGDNPLYVYIVQEDGHQAWSSPIYVVKN